MARVIDTLTAEEVQEALIAAGFVSCGNFERVSSPGKWRVFKNKEGQVVIEVLKKSEGGGYNVAKELLDSVDLPSGGVIEIAQIIEEIGTPSAIEVAKHIREDLENV